MRISNEDVANLQRGLDEWIGRAIEGAAKAQNDSDRQAYHTMRKSAEGTEKRFKDWCKHYNGEELFAS